EGGVEEEVCDDRGAAMNDFDELLDGVLREDAAVQPHAGVEGRVMARVRTEAGHGPKLGLANRWRAWTLIPAAAGLGIVAAIWYVSGGVLSQPDRVASPISPPVLSVEKSGIESSYPVARGDAGLGVSGSGRALRDAHFRRDEAAPKMGHPILENARYLRRKARKVKSASEDEPKLETFPAVSQKGDPTGWIGSDDGKLAALPREVTPALAAAYQQFNAVQNEPIDIAAIEIKPLQ
ncbi:MAG: hypothetical protein ABI380_14555, partial [Edaphobacter sp.]